MSDEARLLTAGDVAERLRISRSAAYDLVRRLPWHVRIGRSIRLPEWALGKYLEKGGDRGRIWWCWGILDGTRWHQSTRCTDQAAAPRMTPALRVVEASDG